MSLTFGGQSERVAAELVSGTCDATVVVEQIGNTGICILANKREK